MISLLAKRPRCSWLVALFVACSPSTQPRSDPKTPSPPAAIASHAAITSASVVPDEDPTEPPVPHGVEVVSGASVKVHPKPPKDGTCPATFVGFDDSKSGDHKCKCAAGVPTGTVWGTSIYTDDSSLCGAAIHVGATKADEGGEVKVTAAPGCAVYKASKRNGVKSSSYTAWGGSFFFPGFGDGKCPPAPSETACAASFKTATLGPDGQVTCQCGADPSGTVYGTFVYTADSSLCSAALHSGAIPKTGDKVTAKSLPGCSSYVGSSNFGITSVKWGAYGASFFFPGFGVGKCP